MNTPNQGRHMEAETIIAAAVPIIVSAIAYGMQSQKVDDLKEDLKDAGDEIDQLKSTHKGTVAELYTLHREQEKDISALKASHDRLSRLEEAVDQLDRDSRMQGNQVAELSVKMGMVYEELRVLKGGVDKILTRFDDHKKQSDDRLDRVLASIETKWAAK